MQKEQYVRSERYLRLVRGQPCLICRHPGEAHHIMYAQGRGVSLKTGDNWVVPLCHRCHMTLHHFGDERTWWAVQGVDPIAWAATSWEKFNGTNRSVGSDADQDDVQEG